MFKTFSSALSNPPNPMNSGPSNVTSNPFHVPSIDFSWNSFSKILLSDDAIATKFGGSMINFALNAFSISESGSGRLDIRNAFNAKLIIEPPNFVAIASSDNKIFEREFQLKSIDGTWNGFDVTFDGPEFIKFEGELTNGNILKIRMSMLEDNFGDHEGIIIINHEDTQYRVPFLFHYTPGSISVNQQNQKLFFEIYHPEEWSFTKISVTNSKDGKTDTTTATPDKKTSIEIYENAEYWIDAKIRVNGTTSDAYNIIQISSISETERADTINIPERQIGIIAVIITLVGIVGLIKRKFY